MTDDPAVIDSLATCQISLKVADGSNLTSPLAFSRKAQVCMLKYHFNPLSKILQWPRWIFPSYISYDISDQVTLQHSVINTPWFLKILYNDKSFYPRHLKPLSFCLPLCFFFFHCTAQVNRTELSYWVSSKDLNMFLRKEKWIKKRIIFVWLDCITSSSWKVNWIRVTMLHTSSDVCEFSGLSKSISHSSVMTILIDFINKVIQYDEIDSP